MLEIEENNGLSPWLCESCIVQLNVAYSFKQRAWEADLKLRELRSHEKDSTRSIDQSSEETSVFENVWVKEEAVIIDEIATMCSGELSTKEPAGNHRCHDQQDRTPRTPSPIPTANSSKVPMVIVNCVSLAPSQDEQFMNTILSSTETSPLATSPQSTKKSDQVADNNESKVKFDLSTPNKHIAPGCSASVSCDNEKHERNIPYSKLSLRAKQADRLKKMLHIDLNLEKTHPSFSSTRRGIRKIKHRRYSVCAVVHGKLT
ncbi:uncharacterized protein LOC128268418 [Anopheles cruzii]|uniref:uncharacterized protein LOC128268418 n=1 Tax=Anopheles cruzii TaxID=68878 RepID=UPI0022EC274D|nr:uncharacterized protein LOC128268418 [Anopheles cruzii]